MAKKNTRNVVLGISILLVLVIAFSYYFINGQSFTILGSEDFTCEVVKECTNCLDFCDDYENCKVINYNNKNVACISGDAITSVVKSPNPIPISTNVVGDIGGDSFE